ncbi:MAG: RNA polymerase sigma factor [Oscillospiraceae bacterium]
MILTALALAVRNENQFNSTNLEEYIAGISTGNQKFLALVYEETKSAVYGFALSILKNTYDAEDIMQSTYINIYNSAENYIPQGKPMAWIFTIVRNLSLMKIRENNKTADIEQEQWGNFPACNDNFSPLDKIVLDSVMKSLSDTERQIVMLHAVSGFKHREIASILELPLSTVLSKYNRAIKKLKILLKEE